MKDVQSHVYRVNSWKYKIANTQDKPLLGQCIELNVWTLVESVQNTQKPKFHLPKLYNKAPKNPDTFTQLTSVDSISSIEQNLSQQAA